MDREGISGISKELDEVLEHMEAGGAARESAAAGEHGECAEEAAGKNEKRRFRAWREPQQEDSRDMLDDDFDEMPDGECVSCVRQEGYRGRYSVSGLIRPSDGILAAFFIPVIIMVVIFAQRGIFPFGEETFLRTDMYHQYAPFFSEFRHKLTSGGSLLYSWDIGMGVNFAALYAYYLASPLNWLVVLCPGAYVIEFMTYMIVFKTGLAGAGFAYYLKRHNHTENFGVCFFGVFYALSGYMAAYSWNIMWLDCILLFPFIMLGLERLVKEKKGMLYSIALGLSILSNYYISIMICLFMVIYYFCLQVFEGQKYVLERVLDFLRFAGYSLLAGALAAIVLLPEIAALQSTASGEFSIPSTVEMYFPIFDMLARHIGNVQTEIGLDHWPNIYCGVAVYLFFILYLGCKRIPLHEKAVYCGLLLFFFASFSINILNYVWHGLHYPNSLPCRQSFIYIFLMLSMCFRAFMYLDVTPRKHIAIAFWTSVCFILLAQKLITDEAYHFVVFYAAIVFLAAYAGIMYLYKDPRRRISAAVLAMAVVAVEAAVNTTVTSVTTTSRTSYVEDNDEVRELTRDLRDSAEFCRVDKTDARTKNDGAWMNFPSASLFSSVASADVTELYRKLGCEASTNAYSIVGSTPLVDSLFSIRYALYKGKQENPRLSLYSFSGETYLYENPWTLPLGFIMPDIVETGWKLDLQTPVDVQNDLSSVLDVPECFELVPGDHDGGIFSFTAPEDGEYYVCIMNSRIESVTLSAGEWTDTVDNVNRGFLIETGYLKAGEMVTLENQDGSESLNARAYLFRQEGLQAIYERLNRNPLTLTVWEDDYLRGEIDAGEGGTLFLSIPYDEGWSVLVDGKPAITRKIWGAFTGLELSAGTHTVELSYMPAGFKKGCVISAAALAVLCVIAGAGKVRARRRRERFAEGKDEKKSGTKT